MKFGESQFGKILLGLALLSSSLMAQSTSGNITGSVFDPTGATVPGAAIVAKNNGTGVENSATSTSKGDYRLENLPAGTYSITVNAAGFTKTEVTNVGVVLNQTVTANVTLPVGTSSTSVQVSESAVAIDTTTAQMQTTFESKEILDLPSASSPTNPTGVLNLSLLAPGVTSAGGAGYGVGPSVGGQRPTNNNFTIEGIDNNSLSITGPIVFVPNEATAEFTVLENQFSPDFGHSSGGQFNQVVKSGSNEFHGQAYEYFSNRNLNAADNLDAVQGNILHPRNDNNRFGGNFGGPVKRNKLFFFGDYEYNPLGQASNTAYYAPTAAGYAALATLPGLNQNNLAQFRKYLGTAPIAASPSTLPNGAAVVVGTATIPVGSISSSLPNFVNREYGVASVDYTLSDKDSLRGRFILNRFGYVDTNGFPSIFFGVQPNNAYLATFSEYHTFSPSVVNEFRLGYNRFNQQYPIFGNQSFPGLDQFPNIAVNELQAGFGPDPNAPQYTVQNLYQLTDNLSLTKGKHSFKFGFDGWSSIAPSKFIQRSRGDYEYTTLAGYLQDTYPDYIAQRSTGNAAYYANQQLLGWYGNDIWKITPNLTVNLGLRYEYNSVPLSENGQSLNASASVPGLITFRSPTTQKTNFMPRVGIAYSPGTSGKTSIRAGLGSTYDVVYSNLGINSKPPQLSSAIDVTGNAGSGFLAGGGISPNASAGVPLGATARGLTTSYIPDQKRPESYNWNLSIQHVFGGKYVFESRYVGTRGLFLPIQVQLNIRPVVNASNALPVYYSMPSVATLNASTNTLGALTAATNARGYITPPFLAAGFVNPITAFMPQGNSVYHGWSNQLSRHFSNGLQFQGSYTWSHNIDDSTDALNSTVLTPRRPQDSQNLRAERGSSLLDHRNRIILEMLYDVPYFKNSNWFLKNIVGNWEIAPVYTFQSGEPVDAQSAVDTNLNHDSAPDRVLVNPLGNNSIGSGTTPLCSGPTAPVCPASNAVTVGYLVNNTKAGYVTAPRGTVANSGRNTILLNPIDDLDLTMLKRFSVRERFHMELAARVSNLFNHPQYVGGYINDVYPFLNETSSSSGGLLERSTLNPSSPNFQQWNQAFSSNPRQLQLSLKVLF